MLLWTCLLALPHCGSFFIQSPNTVLTLSPISLQAEIPSFNSASPPALHSCPHSYIYTQSEHLRPTPLNPLFKQAFGVSMQFGLRNDWPYTRWKAKIIRAAWRGTISAPLADKYSNLQSVHDATRTYFRASL